MSFYTATGTVTVNPDRPANFKKAFKLNTITLELNNDDTCKYYIEQLRSVYGPWMNLAPPMFGLHITIVKGTERFDADVAMKFHGMKLAVKIDPESLARTDYRPGRAAFWYLTAFSSEIFNIRKKLKLEDAIYPHVTIAREQDFTLITRVPASNELMTLADKILALIPYAGTKLEGDLVNFKKLNKLASGEELVKLVRRSINVPSKLWELDILALFKAH